VNVLLDTCVVSELQRSRGNPQVRARVERFESDQLFLSAITIGEISKGVSLLSSGEQKERLIAWLNELEQEFTNRILPVDIEVARLWGELTARAQRNGETIPAIDGLIAATAHRHGLQVMTRNSRHFAAAGVLIDDPWQEA
jgi:predicted nucleic acid-binding protein